MVTLAHITLARRASRTPVAPVVGVMFGLVAAILVAAVPVWMFDRAVAESGLPSILSFAAPPLGLKARALAVGTAFVIIGGGLWLALAQIESLMAKARKGRTPWRDEGYVAIDAPAPVEGRRRPIFAPAELGAPLMSDEAIAPTPVLLLEPVFEPEPELEAPLSAIEFDLPPLEPGAEDDDSIQALIRRLESGLARRAANDPGPDSPTSAELPLSREWIVHESEHDAVDENGSDVRQFLGNLKKLAAR